MTPRCEDCGEEAFDPAARFCIACGGRVTAVAVDEPEAEPVVAPVVDDVETPEEPEPPAAVSPEALAAVTAPVDDFVYIDESEDDDEDGADDDHLAEAAAELAAAAGGDDEPGVGPWVEPELIEEVDSLSEPTRADFPIPDLPTAPAAPRRARRRRNSDEVPMPFVYAGIAVLLLVLLLMLLMG